MSFLALVNRQEASGSTFKRKDNIHISGARIVRSKLDVIARALYFVNFTCNTHYALHHCQKASATIARPEEEPMQMYTWEITCCLGS